MSKYKRTLWVALAIVFVVALFFIKDKTVFKNNSSSVLERISGGLTYENETLENLIKKDTDDDGILDWEEGLWGTDPTKKETTPGTPDGVAVEKLKAEQSENTENKGKNNPANQGEENLTQTDRFSRELFATVAALNQNGTMDQATIDALSASLAEQIQNSAPQKIYVLKDIKIINNDSFQAVKKYSDTLTDIYEKNNKEKGVPEILEKLTADEENMSILKEL